jgi:peptide/nickel transport system permease protein
MIPVVVCIAILIFTIMHFVPGDPAQLLLGNGHTEEEYEAMRVSLGLRDPFFVQLGRYLVNLFFKGDLGTSYVTSGSVAKEVIARIPRTLLLGILGMILSFVFGSLFGIIAAVNQNRWQDRLCMILALIGVSMPAFWLALLLVLLFSVKLGWLPASGIGSIKYYILPTVSNSLGGVAFLARQTRSSMLEVIRSDYITTARSKGLTENEVIMKHALPNAMIPIITILGAQFGQLLGGSLIIETIFNIPGMGSYMISGINNRDYPVVQSCVVVLGIVFCICMLLVDIAYAYIDPRIKAQYADSGKRRAKS